MAYEAVPDEQEQIPLGDRDPVSNEILMEPPCHSGNKCTNECSQQFRSQYEQRQVYDSEGQWQRDSYKQYKGVPSNAEVRGSLKNQTDSINRDFEFLQDICASHGDDITKRWRNLSQAKRASTLLQADPKMYPSKEFIPRRLYTIFAKGKKDSFLEWYKYPTTQLLPYLSVDDLKKDPAKFLCLLLQRTRNSPQQWVAYDTKATDSAWRLGSVDVDFNRNCVVMHGDQYGQLTPWNKEASKRRDILGYPRASLIISAQKLLMSFLRNMVEQLLSGFDSSIVRTADKWNAVDARGFKFAGSTTNPPLYPSAYLNRPFVPPPTFDIDKIISTVKATVRRLSDHVWLLQTYPDYLRHMVGLMRASYIDKSANGDVHFFVAREMYSYFDTLESWQFLEEELQHVREVMTRFPSGIHPGSPLPQEVDEALAALEIATEKISRSFLEKIQTSFAELPGFIDYWEVDDHNKSQLKPSKKLLDVSRYGLLDQDLVHWALIELLCPSTALQKVDEAIIFAMLQEDPEESKMLTGRLRDKVFNAAEVLEILDDLQYCRPFRTKRNVADLTLNPITRFRRHTSKYHQAFNNGNQKKFSKSLTSDLKSLGRDLERFLKVPLPAGVKNPEKLETLNTEWSAMGVFWKSFAAVRRQSYERFRIGSDDIAESTRVFRGDTTPEHEEAKAKLIARLGGTGASVPSQGPAFPSGPSNESASVKIKHPPKKEKTRGPNRDADTLPDMEDLAIDDEVEAIRIRLKDVKSYNIFKLMFRNSESGMKKVKWIDFVNAMTNVHFIATQREGCRVNFEADESAQKHSKGSIVFHQPHPGKDIHPIILQAMGRKMTRWFGWTEEMFELEPK